MHSKIKLGMMSLAPNLALYSYRSLVSIPLISTAFQSMANQNAGFRSYCSHCVLKGQSLHEDQNICADHCTVHLSIFNLGGLQHVQTPKLSTNTSIVATFSCQSSTGVVFLKIDMNLYSSTSNQLLEYSTILKCTNRLYLDCKHRKSVWVSNQGT